MEVTAIKEGCSAFIPTIWLTKVEMVQVLVMLFATCWTSYSTKVYYDSNTHVVCNPKNATVARQCWQNYRENTDPNAFPYWAFVVLQSFVYASPWMVFWIFQKEQAKHLSNRVSALHQDNHEEVNVLVTNHHNNGFFRWQNIMAVARIVFLISIIVVHVVFFNIGHISCRIKSIILNCKVPRITAPFIGIYVANGLLFLLGIAEACFRIRFWKWVCEDKIARKTYQDTLWFSYACEKNNLMTTWRIIAVPEPPQDCTVVLLDAQSVKIQWEMEDGSNVTSYKIEKTVSGIWELVCEVEERVATVFNLNPFKSYSFRVRAANISGESKASYSQSVYRCPLSPCMKICSALAKNSVYLEWKRPRTHEDNNIEEYNVQWQLQGESFWSSKDVVTVNTIVDDLEANKFYWFRVRAKTRRGNGEWSDIVEEKTLENEDHALASDYKPLLLDNKSLVPEESEVPCVQIIPLRFNVCIRRKLCRVLNGRLLEVQWKHQADIYWQAEESVRPEFSIGFLQCRSKYYFRARIEIQPKCYSSWSNTIEVTTLDPPPEPPVIRYGGNCCRIL